MNVPKIGTPPPDHPPTGLPTHGGTTTTRQARITHYPSGQLPAYHTAGDFFVVRDWVEDALGELIQAKGRADVGRKNPIANVTHSGGILDVHGNIAEAEEAGVQQNHIEKYRNADLYIVSPMIASVAARQLCVQRWRSCVGMKYDIVAFVGFFQQTLIGMPWIISDEHGLICSALVAFGALAYKISFARPYQSVTPTLLLLDFGLTLDETPYPENFFARFLDGLVATSRFIRRKLGLLK